jgi:hypothetical protein
MASNKLFCSLVLLKLIYDEGLSAVNHQRFALPAVSRPAATADLTYRLDGVEMI